ncbi:GT2 family glycosyltransferase [Arthrobacter sp. PvP023]|uniref:glycosyltransferase family 2 protein n=1 Tax=Micrococcaceae TaxID=1268 RepID=UPI001AE48B6E|nr:glycosyltransferase family 2 protein [Arthrobacter sp. PvP023]MBP1135099.1 GT2 family glycosyltransferase [Arthrobacter sp. PvP023]
MKFHIIVASHNRRQTTIQSLSSLFAAGDSAGVETRVVLFDDGSKDQTASSVLEMFPSVTVIPGSGSTYWAKSMHQAEKRVLNDAENRIDDAQDYIVWLNDDVVLDIDALSRAIQTLENHPDAILACAMRDPESLQTTYSGFKREGRHPLRLSIVEPGAEVRPIDTFNGNLVLVPGHVARRLGSIDGEYAHALADIDYGYRAKLAGMPVLLAAGTFGTCPRNPPSPAMSLKSMWKSFVGVKGGGHPKSLLRILRLGAPRLFPLFFGATYVLWWARALRDGIMSSVSQATRKNTNAS